MAGLPLFDRLDEESALCSVSELTAQIKATLEADFADVAVSGEVSNLSRPRSGHVYLSLKDESSQVRAVIWKSVAQRLAFDLSDGLSVRVWGDLAVYAPRGEYQVTIRRVEPEGVGALELAFRQRFEKLKAEGLFDSGRKRPLPRFPRRIVVVSSPTGAAIRDFLQVTGRRWSATEILIAPARVQGAGAAEEVAGAIALANRVAGADLIVLARGGGSLEDLWAFNEEVVARAIAGSRLPVISAIGHEVDVTLADHAADFRALTPSEAGERCVPDARETRRALEHIRTRLARDARDRLANARQRLDDLAGALDRALRHQVDHRRHRLARLAAALEALSPLAVLARGYALAFRPGQDTPLRDARELRPGDSIRIRLGSGSVLARAEEVRAEDGSSST
jgi:exodeoxyribonuclease VII large subunit